MLRKMKPVVPLMVVAMLWLSGCQTVPQSSSDQILDNRTFMSLWNTYQHCMSGNDLDQLRNDVSTLTNAPHSRMSPGDFTVPLPDLLQRHVSAQPMRVSADPKAMVAACSLHFSEIALEHGRNEVAAELLNGLLRTHSSGEYGYYIQQAKATLHRIQPSAVYVSQPGAAGLSPNQAKPSAGVSLPATVPPDRQYE